MVQQYGQYAYLKGEPKVVLLSHDNYIFTATSAVVTVLALTNLEDIKRVDELFERMKIVILD